MYTVTLQKSKTVVVIIVIYVYTYDHISQSFPVCYLLIHLPNRQNVFMYVTVLINVRCRSFNTYTRAYSASPPIRLYKRWALYIHSGQAESTKTRTNTTQLCKTTSKKANKTNKTPAR